MDSTTPFQPWAANDGAKKDKELVDDAKHRRENVNHPKQTASYDKDSAVASSNVPGPSNVAGSGDDSSKSIEGKMDSGKIASMQQIVENTLSSEARQRVSQLLEAVEALSGTERLLLYLRLPTGVPPHDPLKQPVNPLGSRAELQQTVTWIQTHLEVDPDVSLPKQDVYDEYIAHCMSNNMKPLSTADFGKVMKQVYPTVRPRRLGTRGNSRYCYAGLRKKIKLEVPLLPDLGESSKESTVASRETERLVCDWAESKLAVKFGSLSELSRYLLSTSLGAARQATVSPPPLTALTQTHGVIDDQANRQLMKHLKRKIQTHGQPGRPKKYKGQDMGGDMSASTSYGQAGAGVGAGVGVTSHAHAVKHEGELPAELEGGPYEYSDQYVPMYDVRAPYAYAPPPHRALLPPHHTPLPHDAYYSPRDLTNPLPHPADLTVPAPADAHNLPINLSSDASLDLSTERAEWQRRRPPEPPPPPPQPPPRHPPLPGKKLILETYQSETQAGSPRPRPAPAPTPAPLDEFPRSEYLPKKMRAAEILGGKLAAARQALAADPPSTSASASAAETPLRSEVAFLEDPKNVSSRSKSTAAALAREEQEAASPTRSAAAPTPKSERGRAPRRGRAGSPDSCCGLDGINMKTGMICEEKHSEILNRERVISICNIDKHDLDDYLNEGNSQENEEELLQYFQQRDADAKTAAAAAAAAVNTSDEVNFLETGLDPQDDHSQGKNEKIFQLRQLLTKNLKNPSGSRLSNHHSHQEPQLVSNHSAAQGPRSDGAFNLVASSHATDIMNGLTASHSGPVNNNNNNSNQLKNGNGINNLPEATDNSTGMMVTSTGTHLYNGNCHNVPQSPTTRTQQYDFVPISDGCHSPRTFKSKSPVGFGHRGLSPSKMNKSVVMGGSLQTSPISHSTAASPFVSPRNTPVPRSRFCSRPIPKLNGRKRRNPLMLGVADHCTNQFAIPIEQKFITKSACVPGIKYCQPMSAPPSPNIIPSHYKNHMFQCGTGMPNGSPLSLQFMPTPPFRERMNGELPYPLSADPLSNEVSQFFQDPLVSYRPQHDSSFRSQSVPLKQGINNMGLLNYKTPVGSVPPTPVPNEFCDFGSLADTCDISKAGLNPETLDKIYDAIDSSNDVLNSGSESLLNATDTMTNGCDLLPEQQILTDELNSLIPNNELLDRGGQYNHQFHEETVATDNVEDFLKRTNSLEFDLTEYQVHDKNKFYVSRSVPSTPLPYKRTAPSLQIDPRRSRELFPADSYNASNGISSKSVPSTPQLVEEKNIFSYSNRDFLINGNSVETCGSSVLHSSVAVANPPLASPLHEILREDMLEPLTPAVDLMADLDKIEGPPYVDL